MNFKPINMAEPASTEKEQTLEKLASARLDLNNPPPRPPAVLSWGAIPVASQGDITTILAPAKSGKSAFCTGIIAAAVLGGAVVSGCDTFGIVAGIRPPNGIVIAFDTEQSKPDQFDLAKRAARRAGVETLPDWVECYNLAGFMPKDIRAMLRAYTEQLKASATPIWFVIIDGIADLCSDVNDLAESQEVVAEVHKLARDHECPMITVVHRNEGRDSDPSARGHLGKQLARKSAYNLTLEKDSDEITVVYSTKNRGAPILKKDGPRFAWSDTAKMHVSVDASVALEADTAELRSLAKTAFGDNHQFRQTALVERIRIISRKGSTWANQVIKKMVSHDVLGKAGDGIHYILK